MRRRRSPALGPRVSLLVAASTVSALGDGVRLVVLPLTTLALTGRALPVTLVTAAATLAWLVCSPLSGAVVDRCGLRPLAVATSGVQALVTAAVALAAVADHVTPALLAAAAFVVGAGQTLVDPAQQAMVPLLVDGRALDVANGRVQAGVRVAGTLAGPALGAVLFARFGAGALLLDAATFAAAGVLQLGVRGLGSARRAAAGGAAPGGVPHDVVAGLRALWSSPVLRRLCSVLAVWALVDTAVLALLPVYARTGIGLPEAGLGVLWSVSAVGGIAGALGNARLTDRIGRARVVVLALALLAAGYAGLALGTLWSALAGMALLGGASSLWVVAAASYRQQYVPAALLGRVTALYRWVGFGPRPLGAVLGGLVASGFALSVPFVAAALVLAVLTVYTACTILPSVPAEAAVRSPDLSR